MICVYAIAKVKPGCARAFEEAGSRLVSASRAESANISYTLCRALDGENVYTFIEQWRNAAGLEQHLSTPHFIAAGVELEGLLDCPLDIHKLESID